MNIRESIQEAVKTLSDKGVASAAIDASLLLCEVLSLSRTELYLNDDNEMPEGKLKQYQSLVHRRGEGEPVAYILGKKEFWGLEFDVELGVLIPRPDTETLIASVMAYVSDVNAELTFADVGVGSGAVVLSILHEYPNFYAKGVDISDTALRITKKNAKKFGVESRLQLIRGEYLNDVDEGLDIVVSNPPYIETSTISTLSEDVKGFEPMEALDGGADGLTCYRVLIPQAYDKLRINGLFAIEIGYNQADAVQKLLGEHGGWMNIQVIKDLAGQNRVITALKK